MPDYPNNLYLSDPEPLPVGVMVPKCLPGRAAVLMHKGEKRGGIWMPPSGRMNPDLGRLIDAGFDDLKPGNEVVVKPYDGKWEDHWHEDRQMRLYGVICPWHESILAQRLDNELLPTWDWVLVERHSTPHHELLPDSMRWSEKEGTIVARGRLAEESTPGATALFDPDTFEKKTWRIAPNLCFVRERDLLAVIA